MKAQLQRTSYDLNLIPYNQATADYVNKHRPGQVFDVEFIEERRSLTKNALSHVWYQQLDRTAFSDHEPGYSRRYCKAHYGIPIMSEDEDFRARYNALIRERFTYEEKLELMDWLPVTSLMNEDQMGRYLHTMQQVFSEGGYILTTPKDSEYEKWCKRAA